MVQPVDRTLIEKAGVDAGFDRRPVWQGDAVLLRSTHHDKAVIVAAPGQATQLQVWVPRVRFSLTLTNVPGVELAERQEAPGPVDYAQPEIALEVADLTALRRLLATCHRVFTRPGAPDAIADAPLTTPCRKRTPRCMRSRSQRRSRGRWWRASARSGSATR